MKYNTFSLVVICILALLALGMVSPVQAQAVVNPNGQTLYYSDPLVSARSYAKNTTDTIPNLVINHWAQAGKQKSILGGASFVTLQIACLDSMYCVIYVDELIGSTWTALAADSVVTATAKTQEIIVRSQYSERTGKLGGAFRARLVFPAYRTQGVADAKDNPMYTAKFLWKR